MTGKTVIAFDLYGTLLSTSSISKALANYVDEDSALSITQTWRTQQLEYTWRLNSMHTYLPFSTVTERSLGHALKAHGKSLDSNATKSIMKAYDSLSTFPDVPEALQAIASNASIQAVVFSNGTQDMVVSSVKKSPDLSPYSSTFADIVTIEEAKCYKPDPSVYKYLCGKVNKEADPGSCWLVSGNPFDVVGARSVGLQAAWVDRAGSGWQDGMIEGDAGRPTVIVQNLNQALVKIEEWTRKNNKG